MYEDAAASELRIKLDRCSIVIRDITMVTHLFNDCFCLNFSA